VAEFMRSYLHEFALGHNPDFGQLNDAAVRIVPIFARFDGEREDVLLKIGLPERLGEPLSHGAVLHFSIRQRPYRRHSIEQPGVVHRESVFDSIEHSCESAPGIRIAEKDFHGETIGRLSNLVKGTIVRPATGNGATADPRQADRARVTISGGPRGGDQPPILPPLPVRKDNAAMDAESINSPPPKRKRRRLQFRLRTLMIAVTLLCISCGYVVRRAQTLKRERDQSVSEYRANVYASLAKLENGHWVPDRRKAPWPLSWFEDGITRIQLPEDAPEGSLERMRESFPEATITKRGDPQPTATAYIP